MTQIERNPTSSRANDSSDDNEGHDYPEATSVDLPLSPSGFAAIKRQYEDEMSVGYISLQAKFSYAWALIKSTSPSEQRQGMILLTEIYRDTPSRRKECLWYLSLGHYKLGNLGRSLRYLEVLEQERASGVPEKEVRRFKGKIEAEIGKERLVGYSIAIAGVAVAGLVCWGAWRRYKRI